MQKQSYFLSVLLGAFLSMTAFAQDQTSSDSSGGKRTFTVTRGQTLTLSELSSITNMSSARDEKGEPVKLDEKEYTVGSFTRTTITVVPPKGGTGSVITLDVNQ